MLWKPLTLAKQFVPHLENKKKRQNVLRGEEFMGIDIIEQNKNFVQYRGGDIILPSLYP